MNLLTSDELAALAEFDTPTICNALEVVMKAGTDPQKVKVIAAALAKVAASPEYKAYLKEQYASEDSYFGSEESLKIMTRMAIYLARHIRLDGLPEYEKEKALIEREVRAIVDKVLEMGDGDTAIGTVRAFEAGVMDIPWSPNRHCKSRVMPARDVDGYLRILDPGLMPFPPEIMHKLFLANPALVEVTARRNSSLQGAYLMIVARALGLDCGPMSGFDNAKLDEEFFGAGKECEGCEQEFFPAGHVKSNFLCNLGYGDPSKLLPRSPRLEFNEACTLM